jgi:hypothetical protein
MGAATRTILLLSFIVLTSTAVAQSEAFDPRDLSGIWVGDTGGGGAVPFGPDMPPLTAAGEARYRQSVPTRSPDTSLRTTRDPSLSNDPTFDCNPRGFPRTMFDTRVRLFEFVPVSGRLLQLIQRERTLRELWLDGRALPAGENLDNIGPAWYGHSVARWEGDTLVVDTVGMDDRAWLDSVGHVKSATARIEERYRRIEPDRIEHRMILFDSEYYSEPFVAETRYFRRESPEHVTYFGWYGLFSGVTDLMCAPMNAIERYREGAY